MLEGDCALDAAAAAAAASCKDLKAPSLACLTGSPTGGLGGGLKQECCGLSCVAAGCFSKNYLQRRDKYSISWCFQALVAHGKARHGATMHGMHVQY
jgi:hypothetical protein